MSPLDFSTKCGRVHCSTTSLRKRTNTTSMARDETDDAASIKILFSFSKQQTVLQIHIMFTGFWLNRPSMAGHTNTIVCTQVTLEHMLGKISHLPASQRSSIHHVDRSLTQLLPDTTSSSQSFMSGGLNMAEPWLMVCCLIIKTPDVTCTVFCFGGMLVNHF